MLEGDRGRQGGRTGGARRSAGADLTRGSPRSPRPALLFLVSRHFYSSFTPLVVSAALFLRSPRERYSPGPFGCVPVRKRRSYLRACLSGPDPDAQCPGNHHRVSPVVFDVLCILAPVVFFLPPSVPFSFVAYTFFPPRMVIVFLFVLETPVSPCRLPVDVSCIVVSSFFSVTLFS